LSSCTDSGEAGIQAASWISPAGSHLCTTITTLMMNESNLIPTTFEIIMGNLKTRVACTCGILVAAKFHYLLPQLLREPWQKRKNRDSFSGKLDSPD